MTVANPPTQGEELRAALLAGLDYLVSISYVEDDEVRISGNLRRSDGIQGSCVSIEAPHQGACTRGGVGMVFAYCHLQKNDKALGISPALRPVFKICPDIKNCSVP